jgi:hypothetical protein
MASFIYFYAKFTEEFLLLGAAGIFTLLSVYCYHWVIKKRRLGAARDLVPAGMVKVYLNQLIDEAQFVRTQLFGLIGSGPTQNLADFEGIFARNSTGAATGSSRTASAGDAAAGNIPDELLERLHALENQLSEKEGMVVNINVEKTKLLEEIDRLKQNQNSGPTTNAAAGAGDDLVKKVKMLEQRLEEYSLFEDDLANLKRLQQENSQLKKRIEEVAPNSAPIAAAPTIAAVPAPATPVASAPEVKAEEAEKTDDANGMSLDQNAIDALLEGTSPTPPVAPVIQNEKDQAAIDALIASQQAPRVAAPISAPTPAVAEPVAAKTAAPSDDFEKLVDSVETSLDEKQAAAKKIAAAPAEAAPKAETAPIEALAEKSDEELLKEFENLLNS